MTETVSVNRDQLVKILAQVEAALEEIKELRNQIKAKQ
jgi:hypothetical protein